MVRFSIRKKFWKALFLFYQLVVFLCHLYVGKRRYMAKRPCHFPFGQISLQNHVTTHLSQSEGSILSSLQVADKPCEISWDFTQNFTKFHSHLKSKAVRTALLKTRPNYHKTAKSSPPPFPKILRAPLSNQ